MRAVSDVTGWIGACPTTLCPPTVPSPSPERVLPFASWLAVEPVPFVPEVLLHQAEDLQGLWEATGVEAPPYWAFAWLGGQVLARHVLDQPSLVHGLRVLDVATGSGLVAIAAALAGAADVLAADIDPLSQAVVRANADVNGVAVGWTGIDLLEGPMPDVDVVLAGDVLYDRDMAPRMLSWLRSSTVHVLLGDPGRDYLPPQGLTVVAEHQVPASRELEGVTVKRCRVFTLGAS
jgi:predicted nicotinamide N-methyase